MTAKTILALLSEPTGMVLLVRRRNSVLWSLPGGDIRPSVPADDLLTTYCQRQVGVTPDFDLPFGTFDFAGLRIMVGAAEIPQARAGARGRIERVTWVQPAQLPCDIDPAARIAIALRELRPVRSAPQPEVSAFVPVR